MIRQSISFSASNDQWLNSLLEYEEYASKSETELIRAKLMVSEKSGFITQTIEKIRAEFKAELQ